MRSIIAQDALFEAHMAEVLDPNNGYIFRHSVSAPVPYEKELDHVLRVSLTPRREILVPIYA